MNDKHALERVINPMDVMTPQQRHKAMSHNRGRTRPERALASAIWRMGIRYLTHEGYKSLRGESLLGKPDLVFSRKGIVIFVDGCFWHGCLECDKSPKQSGKFWEDKIAGNRKRDHRVTSELKNKGWTVIRIPEHSVRTKTALEQTMYWLEPILRADPTRIADPSEGDNYG